jgi:LysM repeat protein
MNRTVVLGCLVLMFILVLAIGGAIFATMQIPDVAQQLDAVTPRTVVMITQPLNASHWLLTAPIPVSATAVGTKPIQSLELWVDGALVETKNGSNGSATWNWTIKTEGEHTIIVRAKDSRGQIANSNAVRVNGVRNSNPGVTMVYPVKPGETVASVAANFKTTPQKIIDLNPKLGADSPLAPGSPIKIPVQISPMPVPPPPPENSDDPLSDLPTQPPVFTTVNPLLIWFGKFFKQSAPLTPGLTIKVSDCAIKVLITDNSDSEDGFNVYRLDPNAQTFKRVATLGANSNAAFPIEYTDPDLFGAVSYYIGAFNALGETPSKIASAKISNPDCQTPYWLGMKMIPLELPNLPSKLNKYDKAYFYLEINNQPWGRVPQDPNAFLILPNGKFDVDAQLKANVPLPPQGAGTLVVDAWGWQSGKLTHIGKFTRKFGAAQQTAQTPQILAVCNDPLDPSKLNCGDHFQMQNVQFGDWQTVAFHWSAKKGTAGIYQVWSFPLPTTQDCPVNVPGIIASGFIGNLGGQTGSNTFKIDFKPWKPTTSFAVRVIALSQQGQAICEQSNTIHLNFKPTASSGQMPDPYDFIIEKVTPYEFPNPQDAFCLQVVKNDYYQPIPAGLDYSTFVGNLRDALQALGQPPDVVQWRPYWIPIPVGWALCPAKYQPPVDPCVDDSLSLACASATFKATWQQFENGINDASNGYQYGKSWIVDHAAEATGCNSAICKQAFQAGLNLGLAALGLPTSLPNVKELRQQGEAYAAEAMLSRLGLSCTDPNDPCNQLVQMGRDKAKTVFIQQFDKLFEETQKNENRAACFEGGNLDAAHANGVEPLCIPAQDWAHIVTQRTPGAIAKPAVITLSVIRKPSVPDSALPESFACTFKVESSATNSSYAGNIVMLGGSIAWGGKVITSDQVMGTSGLFKDVVGEIPQKLPTPQLLNPGQPAPQISIPIALTPNSATFYQGGDVYAGYWINEHWARNYYDPLWQLAGDPDDWPMLYRGADATFTIKETCTPYAPGFTGFQNVVKLQVPHHFGK